MAGDPERLGETLTRHYRLSCELFGSYPVPHLTHQLSQGSLDLHLDDTVDLDHLEVLCHTLKNKISPTSLRVIVSTAKVVSSVMARVVERAVEGVAVCVVASHTLTSLRLDGVRLGGRTLKLLCEGLRKARTVKALVMRNCGLGDSGIESLCQAVKNVPSITHLSLVNCGMAERGAIAVACLIKHQRLNRDCAMWQDTLRQRQPHLDAMKGLRRLTLNSNPALGDQGVAAITEALTEDLWIKVLELQHCGVGTEGGASVQALLQANQTLEVIDLRNNPFLPDTVVGQVTGLLQERGSEAASQYSWLRTLELEEKEEFVVGHGHQKGGTPRDRNSGRVVRSRKSKQIPYVHPSKRPTPPSQLGVPWRVEHRLYERREGLAPGAMVKGCNEEWESDGEVIPPSKESVSEADEKEKMRRKLQLYKKKYQKEHEQRKKLERKMSRIQAQLRGLHTVDEATLTHIEECFFKFHIFLSMMQDSGEDPQSPSSSIGVSPSCHLPMEPNRIQIHPANILLSENLACPSPSILPIPVIIHQPSTSNNQSITASHPSDSKLGDNVMLEKAECDSKLSSKRKKENLNMIRPEQNFVGQDHTSGSEIQEKNDIGVTSEIFASSQPRNTYSSTWGQLASKGGGEGATLVKEIVEGVITNIKNCKHKSEISSNKDSDYSYSNPVKEKEKQERTQFNDDLGEFKKTAKEQELLIKSSDDSVAVRVELGGDESKQINEEWNNEKTIKPFDEIDAKRSLSVRGEEELERAPPSEELSFINKVMEIHSLQGFMEGNWHEGKSVEKTHLSKPKSQRSGKSESLITIKSQISKRGQLPQQTHSSHLYQEHLTPNKIAEESLHQHTLEYQESSGSHSSSQSLPSQSPRKAHLTHRCQLPQRSKSQQKQSPKKSTSPRIEPLEIQGNEVSETDDEKMRNLSVWLQRRATTASSTSSSVSISEHLQHSHTSWTKRKGCREEKAREEEDREMELPGGSEIDLYDCEDLSLSSITLTNTSVPENINTGGEEDL